MDVCVVRVVCSRQCSDLIADHVHDPGTFICSMRPHAHRHLLQIYRANKLRLQYKMGKKPVCSYKD